MRGQFIVVEGSEGVGKSTNIDFIRNWLTDNKIEFIQTREPGGTKLGEKLREVLLHSNDMNIDDNSELLMMMAARAAHISQVIEPALQAGKVVLCDRFIDSTYAYQGYGRQMDLARLDALADWTLQGLSPDLVLLLDAPVELAFGRIANRAQDRFEQLGKPFFERVREGFRARAQVGKNTVIIDASVELKQVQEQIKQCLTQFFGRKVG